MEVKEAIGTRRSSRYLLPHIPVEREKIQKMLEAARLASHWGNVQALKAVVVERSSAPDNVKKSLFAPIAGFQIKQAPIVIVWYLDFAQLDVQGDRLRELVEVRALGVNKEAAIKSLNNFLIPFFEKAMPQVKESGLTEFDCGQGVAQATLVAVSEGLGCCCLGGANPAAVQKALKLPDTAKVMVLQCVGYMAETREAGGQRPRLPFGDRFFLNTTETPFPRDEAVVEELKEAKMLQAPGPLPWREEELMFLQKGLDLPDF